MENNNHSLKCITEKELKELTEKLKVLCKKHKKKENKGKEIIFKKYINCKKCLQYKYLNISNFFSNKLIKAFINNIDYSKIVIDKKIEKE